MGQSLLGQSTWFALGMALAVASVAEPQPERRSSGAAGRDRAPRASAGPARRWPSRRWCWSAGDAGGLFGIVAALPTQQPFAKTLADIALTAIPGRAAHAAGGRSSGGGGGLPRRVLASAPLAWLGLISYGVYLWHLTVAELIARPSVPQHFPAAGLDLAGRIPNGATPVVLVLTLVAACALAAVSYRFVELPFLRARRAERRRRTGTRTPNCTPHSPDFGSTTGLSTARGPLWTAGNRVRTVAGLSHGRPVRCPRS